MTMAPLQRLQIWPLNLLDSEDVFSETDDGFVDVQVATAPLQQHYQNSQVDTKPNAVPSSSTSSSTSSKTTKKSVSFALSNDICIIENKKLLPEEEKANIWYEKKDFYRFKDSCRRIIEWITSRHHSLNYCSLNPWGHDDLNDEEETKFCMRGLERHTPEGTVKYIQRNHSRGNDMFVLRMTGASSAEIATIMVQHSLPCVAEAQERARQDALAAWRYQHEQGQPQQPSPMKLPTLPDTWASLLPTIRPIRDQFAT